MARGGDRAAVDDNARRGVRKAPRPLVGGDGDLEAGPGREPILAALGAKRGRDQPERDDRQDREKTASATGAESRSRRLEPLAAPEADDGDPDGTEDEDDDRDRTPRYTWKSELNPAAVSCGRSTGRLLPVRASAANGSGRRRLGQEADRAARLENGVVDVGQVGELFIRAWAASSRMVIRSRRRLPWSGRPCSTRITGSPSITVLKRGDL